MIGRIILFLAGFMVAAGTMLCLWAQVGPFEWVARPPFAQAGEVPVSLGLLSCMFVGGWVLFLVCRPFRLRIVRWEIPSAIGVTTAFVTVSAFGLATVVRAGAQRTALPARIALSSASIWPQPLQLPPDFGGQFDATRCIRVQRAPRPGVSGSTVADACFYPIWVNGSVAGFLKAKGGISVVHARENSMPGQGTLVREPLPLLVRRELISQKLPAPVFAPVFHYGESPLHTQIEWFMPVGFLMLVGGILALHRLRN
jgi:hypothetical protein